MHLSTRMHVYTEHLYLFRFEEEGPFAYIFLVKKPGSNITIKELMQ